MEEPPIYTATVVFYHVWNVNLTSKSTATYTTTHSNSAGTYTLWPFVRGRQWEDADKIETLSVPVMVTSPGGLQTITEPVSVATRSPAIQRNPRPQAPSTLSSTASSSAVPTSTAAIDFDRSWKPAQSQTNMDSKAPEPLVSPGMLFVGLVLVALAAFVVRRRRNRRVRLEDSPR